LILLDNASETAKVVLMAQNGLPPKRFTREALRRLEQYDWPGNVRQLSHVVERAITLSDGESIDMADLGLEDFPQPASHLTTPEAAGLQPSGTLLQEHFNLDMVTHRLVVAALEQTRGHKGQAAALLGIHPRTLTRVLRRFGLLDE
jgi:DNA-binding NtrC family response regulator